MRYFLQFATMVGDVALFTAVGYMLLTTRGDGFIMLLSACCLVKWFRTGNLEAWRPSMVRQFMKNAKKVGL